MKTIVIFCALWQLTFGSTYVINKDPVTYTIDMAQPANIRWKQACEDYANHALNVYEYTVSSLPSSVVSEFEDIAANYYQNYVKEPYLSEINYFSQCMNLTITQVSSKQIFYSTTTKNFKTKISQTKPKATPIA